LKGNWEAERDPLVALQAGDPTLFESFVRTEVSTLLSFFVHLGAERTEAEDLTQDVLVKLYKSATHYQPRAAFSSYALRVARNAWIDRRRRNAVRPGGASLDDLSGAEGDGAPLSERLEAPASDVLAIAALAEDRQRLQRAIAQLPPAHAAVFDLAVLRELPYAQISEALSIPVGTVKSRVFNALRKLREILEGGAA
jgi:RNA polymerase sigma-70 factor (ECF subfamily)